MRWDNQSETWFRILCILINLRLKFLDFCLSERQSDSVCVVVCWCRGSYQYFLQLTKDMSEGRLVAPFQTTILLASLAVQCESHCMLWLVPSWLLCRWLDISLAVLFFSHSRSEGWPQPHSGHTFSIYPCPLSFWLTLPRRVLIALASLSISSNLSKWITRLNGYHLSGPTLTQCKV